MNYFVKIVFSLVATTSCFSVGFASTMERGPDGELKVASDNLGSHIFRCGEQTAHVLKSDGQGIVFFLSTRSDSGSKMIDISADFLESIDEKNKPAGFELKCFSGEDYISVHVPATPEMNERHLMIMNDGRILNGYNLFGNGDEISQTK